MTKQSSSETAKRPVNAALATPTDLSNKSTQPVIVELNKLVADAYSLYVKTKN